MRRIVLVRHGESLWNAERRLQGQADIELSDDGRRQSEELRPLIRALGPEVSVTSDLRRASETAAILGFGSAQHDRRWRELTLGDWTGRRIADIRASDGERFSAWRTGAYTPPEAEPYAELERRVGEALRALAGSAGDTALVVTHGGPIRATVASLLGVDPGALLPVRPASLTILDLDGVPRLAGYNVAATMDETEAPD